MTEQTKPEPTKRPPDRPPMPPYKRSVLTIIVVSFAVLVVVGYTALGFTQRELKSVAKDEIPGSVRSSPGGYRSFSFWYVGYHGGK